MHLRRLAGVRVSGSLLPKSVNSNLDCPTAPPETSCAYFNLNSMVVKPLGGTFTSCDTGLNTAVGVTVTW